MAAIDEKEVARIAHLARLTLSNDETQQLTRDMQAMLDYVKKLEELDVKNVPATAHATLSSVFLREDEVKEGLGAEKALANSPERIGDGFGVPKIIE